jgi:hypothetical protein
MTRSLLFILGLLAAFPLFSQQKCDSSALQADQELLQNFWTAFKDAVNHKDKVKLSSLCRFPFNCDYCLPESKKFKPYIKVTKAMFDKTQHQIFFEDMLVTEINKYILPQDLFIFRPYYNTIHKKCTYSFGYIVRYENDQHPGMQHFFDIEKIDGQFKIISTWTLP